jgi:hypothetical protein
MLAVPMAVITLITVLLVTVLSAGSIRSWRQGQDALERMEQFRQLLVLQEVLGLERGPTNGAMSIRSLFHPNSVRRSQRAARRLIGA